MDYFLTLIFALINISLSMIQRIQSIFLLIAVVALSVQFITPLTKSSVQDMGYYQDGILYTKEYLPALLLLTLSAILIAGTIFLFKNRKTQKLVLISGLVMVFATILFSLYSFYLPTQTLIETQHAVLTPGAGIFMPVIELISLILAYRGIVKDDKIVKSMDRLR